MMSASDRELVDIFMKAQAEPEGRMFSENVLAGLKAVLAHCHPKPQRMVYDYPLGRFVAQVVLPRDMTTNEANRIGAFVMSLAQCEPQPERE